MKAGMIWPSICLTLYAVNYNIVCMTIYTPQQLDPKLPLYKAIADAIHRDIRSGTLETGARLLPQRELADILGVNVSTVTRGYQEAERQGLITATIGRGTFVTADADTKSSLVASDPASTGLLDLGLVAPLYRQEPDPSKALTDLARHPLLTGFFRYTHPRGLNRHRAAGAAWAGRYGLDVHEENVIVCAGAQHALTCVLTALFNAGDRIAVDALTYPGIKTLAAMLDIRLVPVAMDNDGMDPDALETACRRQAVQGLYLMPGCQNPTTCHMPEKRRDAIADTALRHGLLVVEDDAYALTRPENRDDPDLPVAARIPERHVFIAGVSKAFMAGARIAFMAASPSLTASLTQAVLNTMWMAPSINAELITSWIKDGTADRTVAAKRQAASRRFRAARRLLSGLSFSGHETGYYLWLHLPGDWTGKLLEARAREAGINIFGAERFIVGSGPAPRAARLSLTGPERLADLENGITRLRQVLDAPLVTPIF